MRKKKPVGQIFPEEFYDLFTLKMLGETMFDKIKWLVVISMLGYMCYTDYQNEVKFVEHRKEVQHWKNKITLQLGRELDMRVYATSTQIVEDAVTLIEKNNNDYITKVDSVLTIYEGRRKALLALLHDKIDFYGEKIDFFDKNLDSTIQDYTTALEVAVDIKTDMVKTDMVKLQNQVNEVDSLIFKLKNHWTTKGAFK